MRRVAPLGLGHSGAIATKTDFCRAPVVIDIDVDHYRLFRLEALHTQHNQRVNQEMSSSTEWWDASLVTVPFITAIIEECAGFDIRRALAETSVPVFLAYGKYDFTAPPVNQLVEANLPGVHVELFERSGHYPHVEEEQEFAQRYRAWATQVAVAAEAPRSI